MDFNNRIVTRTDFNSCSILTTDTIQLMTLSDSVVKIKQINESSAKKLEKLEITTIRDLLTHFPRKYVDSSKVISVFDIVKNPVPENEYTVAGKLSDFSNSYIRGRVSIQKCKLTDSSGYILCMWFNQPYLKNALKMNTEYTMIGKIKILKNGNINFYPRLFEQVLENRELVHTARIVPEYNLTDGISRKWFRNRIKSVTDDLNNIAIQDELYLNKITGESLKDSIRKIHFPNSDKDIKESSTILSLNELVNIHLKLAEKRSTSQKYLAPAVANNNSIEKIAEFIKTFPFELTEDQKKIIKIITANILNKKLLNLLVQGDVGSGKTVVAITAALLLHYQKYQTVVLAPTTILAEQHYFTFKKFLKDIPVKIELVTSANRKTEGGDILIGTSAVLARKQSLIKNLGLVVVDEQHRFGVKQREELLEPFKEKFLGNFLPHFINMTATPIPRTIAQVFFGDTDVEIINSKPVGRLPIKTHVIAEEKRESSFEWIEEQVSSGNQVYWICPLIEESEKLQVKSAEATFDTLRKIFPKRKIGLLHGKLKAKDKSEIMTKFSKGAIEILISTSVIEVGMDVPNATIMIIESPERFGLAQLHQIRGRVGRSDKQSYCFLFLSEQISSEAKSRLEFFAKTNDGFKIAEFDLQSRGPGEVYGTRQSGLPNLRIATFSDVNLIKKSKLVAEKLYSLGYREIDLFA
jgi:ATP-dependent DNA helicase RecG